MNAELLKDIIELAIEKDAESGISEELDGFVVVFEELTANPTNADIQSKFKSTLDSLRSVIDDSESYLTNVEKGRLNSINALSWFTLSLADKLQKAITDNNMTPTVALVEIKAIIANRKRFFTLVSGTNHGLKTLGIKGYHLVQGIPEISVTIPRSLFHDQLSGLINELRQVSFIARTLAAVAGEETSELKVGTISTTDPQFYFETTMKVAGVFAAAVTWGLDTLQRIENLKKSRSDMSTTDFSEEELKKIFDPKIKSVVEAATKQLKTELLGGPRSTRRREIGPSFDIVIPQLLGRLEHGLKVELHFLPRPEETEVGKDDDGAPVMELHIPEDQQQLVEAADKIVFPEHTSVPVLSISFEEPAIADKTEPKQADDID